MSPIDYKGFLAKVNGGQPDTSVVSQETPQETDPREPSRQPAADSALASKLESTAEKAIEKIDEIMAIPLDPRDAHFGGVLRAQNAAANTALTVQVRVDEAKLRARAPDKLAELLELITQEEKHMRAAGQSVHGDRDG